MKFPGEEFCGDNNLILMVVGKVPEGSQGMPEVAFTLENNNYEAFHILFDVENDHVRRWGVDNGTKKQEQGEPEEGTTIDYDEPFIAKYSLFSLTITFIHIFVTFP